MFILLEKAEEGGFEGEGGRGSTRDARVLGSFCSSFSFFFLCPFRSCLRLSGQSVIDENGRAHRNCISYLASAVPENPPISSIQQQQAEQMRIYWKVSISILILFVSPFALPHVWSLSPTPFFLLDNWSWNLPQSTKFIEGMLTNIGMLPLARIQTMLKFAPGYDRSIEQLALFMEAARREGLVVVRDGLWRLNK